MILFAPFAFRIRFNSNSSCVCRGKSKPVLDLEKTVKQSFFVRGIISLSISVAIVLQGLKYNTRDPQFNHAFFHYSVKIIHELLFVNIQLESPKLSYQIKLFTEIG
jgi:hypothetical protein